MFSPIVSVCWGLWCLLVPCALSTSLTAVPVVWWMFICVIFESSDCGWVWGSCNPCWGLLPSSPLLLISFAGHGVSKPIKSGWASPSGSTSSGIGRNSDSISFISWSNIRISSLHNSFTSLLIHWIHVGGIEFSISIRSGNLYGLLNSIIPRFLWSQSSVAKLSSVSSYCIDSSIDYSESVPKLVHHISSFIHHF